MADDFKSPSSKALASIDSSKYPDTNKDFEANMQRLNVFVDYMASYMGEMQKGIDDANRDIFQQIQDFISDVVVLFSGGDITNGMDLGDLQYFLPAIGALLGFDADTPFPINLFQAAEHFLLGYIVPLDAFTTVIEDIVNGFLNFLGVDEDFIAAIDDLLEAVGEIGEEVGHVFEVLFGFLDDILNIFGLGGFGIVGDIWHAITMLLSGNPIAGLVNLIDPILHLLAPWIKELADVVEFFVGIIHGIIGIVDGVGDAVVGFVSFLWNLFTGLLKPSQNSTTAAGGVSAVTNNLLTEPTFEAAITITDDDGDWTWDPDTDFPDPNATNPVAGSVKVTANGTLLELISNEIQVAQKQKYKFSVYVSWADVQYSGSDPIVLGITQYFEGEEVGSIDIDTIAYPSTNSTWTLLEGTYTIPVVEFLKVDVIRMRFKVGSNMVAGNVWWDVAILKSADTGTQDNIMNKMFGWLGWGYSHDEEAEALQAQANAMLYQNAQIAKMWAILSSNPVIIDDFERAPGGLGVNWDQIKTSTNYWAVDGHTCYWYQPWPALGHGFALCLNKGANAESVTDYQTNELIMAGAPQAQFDWWWQYGTNYVVGRSDSTGSNRIEFLWRADRYWSLNKVVGGTATSMDHGTLDTMPGAASRVVLMCGDKANTIPRYFKVVIDGRIITEGDFGDTTSMYGSGYRKRGFAGDFQAQPLALLVGAQPGSIDDFIGMDTD